MMNLQNVFPIPIQTLCLLFIKYVKKFVSYHEMDRFQSERIELLKIQLYGIVGQLEIEKNILITDNELKIFENNLSKCNSEVEASGILLGAIRRYKIKLQNTGELLRFQE